MVIFLVSINNNNRTFVLSLRVLYDTLNTPGLKCKNHFVKLWYKIILKKKQIKIDKLGEYDFSYPAIYWHSSLVLI